MCGIFGFIGGSLPPDEALHDARDTLAHRGPQRSGSWKDPLGQVYFGHRRLKIIDLSENGHQPMCSASGRWSITFNGEIYNYKHLFQELVHQGVRFRGTCDTEVLLEALDAWGVETTLSRIRGMFAFAAFNLETKRVVFARDAFGKKPLYIARLKDGVCFASELKPILTIGRGECTLDREGIALLFRHNCIPAPLTVLRECRKLPPGAVLELPLDSVLRAGGGIEDHFASLQTYFHPTLSPLHDISKEEAIDSCDALIRQAVDRRLMADVPLGAFLSGGIDSSVVVAYMTEQSPSRVRTFSIGFEEQEFNEADHARTVADHLDTDHTELIVSAQDALNLVPALPEIYDEPFADSSQIPTALLCRLTKRHVTVALSGDGGDEMFLGYPRYGLVLKVWRILRLFPTPIRRGLGGILHQLSAPSLQRLIAALLLAFPGSEKQVRNVRDRGDLLGHAIGAETISQLYREAYRHWQGYGDPVIDVSPSFRYAAVTSPDPMRILAECDRTMYLPDDILVKVDRASMAASLEVRCPLLDSDLYEFVVRLPSSLHLHAGLGKSLLRGLLTQHIPASLFDRPKMGFGIPLAAWLRGPLREWAEALLSERALGKTGFFDVPSIRQVWQTHLKGDRDLGALIWNVCMFQAWYERYCSYLRNGSAG